MDDITENFVTGCLIKVQTFFESMCGNSQLDERIIFKKILMDCSVSTQKQSLSKVSACCRCSLPS